MAIVRQYDRGVRLTVIPPDGPGILVNPLPPSGTGPTTPQLRVEFSVSRSLDLNPGRAAINVTNLGKLSLGRIEGAVGRVGDPASLATTSALRAIDATLAPGPPLVTIADAGHATTILEAGYAGMLGTIFTGAASRISSRWNGFERKTSIVASDGGLETSTARVHKSFERGTPLLSILKYVAKTLTMRLAPTPALALLANDILDGGFVAYGYARDALADLLSPLQLEQEWWIDDGTISIVNKGLPLPLPPVTIANVKTVGAHRLIAEPDGIEDNGVRVQTMLIGPVQIGQSVVLVAGRLSGTYRCEAILHRGDNRGGPFNTSLVLRQPGL